MRGKSPKDILGEQGEEIVQTWLIKQGYHILMVSRIEEIEGGAPMLKGEDDKASPPDILAWKEGQPGWVEVKTKSDATKHEQYPHRWEHGFPLRHWEAYLKVQAQTGIPVTIAVAEAKPPPGRLLIATIKALAKGKRVSLMDGEMHVFFNRGKYTGKGKFPQDIGDFQRCESLLNIGVLIPIPPEAERTKRQPPTPDHGQLPLF